MRISAPATSNPGFDLTQLDELDVFFTKKHDFEQLLAFCNKFSDQRINLCFEKDTNLLSSEELIQINNTLQNKLYIRLQPQQLDLRDFLEKNNIKYFIDYPVDSYIKLRWMLDYTHTTDIYITDDLCYNFDVIKTMCNLKNINIRMVLNRIPSTFVYAGEMIDAPIFRPSDFDLLQQWIDTAEFDCWEKDGKYNWNKFSVLYKRWFIDKEWSASLNHLNCDILFDFPPNVFSEYSSIKMNCKHRCMSSGASCKTCQRWINFAKTTNDYFIEKINKE